MLTLLIVIFSSPAKIFTLWVSSIIVESVINKEEGRVGRSGRFSTHHGMVIK